MKYTLATKHFDLSEADRELVDEKLNRLKKHLRPPFQTEVVLNQDTHHRRGDVFTCKVTIEQEGGVSHAERSAPSVLTALDEVVNILQRELQRRHRKRNRKRWRIPNPWKR